jgi:hypothetical protein
VMGCEETRFFSFSRNALLVPAVGALATLSLGLEWRFKCELFLAVDGMRF